MPSNLKELVFGSLFLVSLIFIAYANNELHKALLVRVAACQTVKDPALYRDFECSRALKELEK